DRELRLPRQRREQREEPMRRWGLHLGGVAARVGGPAGVGPGLGEGEADQRRAWRDLGQPDVVEIPLGDVHLPHAARGVAHGADPKAFPRPAGRSETNDAKHRILRGGPQEPVASSWSESTKRRKAGSSARFGLVYWSM